eukprot:943787-Amphidinium_carterae.2
MRSRQTQRSSLSTCQSCSPTTRRGEKGQQTVSSYAIVASCPLASSHKVCALAASQQTRKSWRSHKTQTTSNAGHRPTLSPCT